MIFTRSPVNFSIFYQDICSNSEKIWNETSLFILDSPTLSNYKLEERMKLIQDKIPETQVFKFPKFSLCESREHMLQMRKDRGTDLLLRKPNSYYYDTGSVLEVAVLKLYIFVI